MNELRHLSSLARFALPLDMPLVHVDQARELMVAWPALRSIGFRGRHQALPEWAQGLAHHTPLKSPSDVLALTCARMREAMGLLTWEAWGAVQHMEDLRPDLLAQVKGFSAWHVNNGPDSPAELGKKAHTPVFSSDVEKAFRLAWEMELGSPSGPLHPLLSVLANAAGTSRIEVRLDSLQSVMEGFLGPQAYPAYRAALLTQALPEEVAPALTQRLRF